MTREDDMPKHFNGRIELDIRDSEPDWTPYLAPKAPEGAPNVLFLTWDDLGYATMDIFGGPVECPNMRRIQEKGVTFSNFHTTALCSPTRASLLTGRNATSNGMATIAEFASRIPRHLDPHPVRERLHLRGARRARLQHVLHRQVAPHPG
ncbi:MAG: sulfatase-like hydrolase/transferase [Microthrixaceae bacterium]|nr:sulfatase-like hydrolase/transferase [Microthrixaceae bacterium]